MLTKWRGSAFGGKRPNDKSVIDESLIQPLQLENTHWIGKS